MITQVLLVDDHPIVREGFSALLSRESDIEVSAEAGSVREALDQVRRSVPDLAIIDVGLPDGSGTVLIRQLHARYPELPMLVASMYDEQVYAERVIRLGARGYIRKRDASKTIVHAVREVLDGRIYLSETISQSLLNRLSDNQTEGPHSAFERLTTREIEVLQLLSEGLTSRSIGEQLSLSPKTVDSYRDRIKQKMNLKNGAELLRLAFDWSRDQSN
jgi:DNA-binding NarL/FixJ family response regulator